MTSTTDLLSFRNAAPIGDVDGVAPLTLGRLAASRLVERGFHQYDDVHTDALHVYRVDETGAQRIPLRDFRSHVLTEIHAILDETLAEHVTAQGIRRVSATKKALDRGERGAVSWERLAVEHARDALPDLDEDAAEAADAAARARRAAQAATTAAERAALVGTPRERQRASRATTRAAEREQAAEELRRRLPGWLAATVESPVEIGEVWDAWRAAVARAPQFASEHPHAANVGRTTFYQIALPLLDMRAAGGRHRIVWAPYGLRIRYLMGRRDLVAALRLHAQRHASTGDNS